MIDQLRRLTSSGFFHVFGSSTINQIVSFAYGILVVRIISKAEYGVYAYANNIYSLFSLLSGFGIASAAMQFGSERANNSSYITQLFSYSNRFGIIFNASLSAIIAIVAILIPLPIYGSNDLLLIMALLPVPSIIKELQIIWLRVNLRNKHFSYSNTLNAVLTAGISLAGAKLFSAAGIVLGHYLVLAIMITFLSASMQVPLVLRDRTIEKSERRDLVQVAGISTLNNTMSQLLTLLGAFMLGLVVRDDNIIASYKVATTIPFALNFIPSSLMVFAYPYFARNKNNRTWVRTHFRKLIFGAGVLNGTITLFGIILAYPLITTIYGQAYADSVPSFRILLIAFFFSGTFRTISGNILLTQRKLKANMFVGLIGSVCTILLNIFLIPLLGSMGAAISNLLTMLITGVLAIALLQVAIHKLP